jgi:hypothetical protein
VSRSVPTNTEVITLGVDTHKDIHVAPSPWMAWSDASSLRAYLRSRRATRIS